MKSIDDDLIDVIPYDARGEAGLTFIIARQNYDAWVIENAEVLLARGYVRFTVETHKKTQAFGDKRTRRRP